jgi:6-phosphofructokinase 1
MDTVYETLRAAGECGWELKAMGIPKTIDNDLILTDHCPGYGSAARYLAITCAEIKRDTLALTLTERVKILEVMGRNTGWLTAATALAGDYAPDLIYLPERPFYEEAFLGEVDNAVRQHGCAVVAACEGIRHADGSFVSMNTDPLNQDAFGHPEPGGVGHHLTELVMERLKLKARYDKPGTMQRCSGLGASGVDIQEAYKVGWEAVRRAASDENGKMITLEREAGEAYCCTTGAVPLENVKNAEKKMPAEYIGNDGSRPTAAFEAYARPLLGDPLPEYVTLSLQRVPKRIGRLPEKSSG